MSLCTELHASEQKFAPQRTHRYVDSKEQTEQSLYGGLHPGVPEAAATSTDRNVSFEGSEAGSSIKSISIVLLCLRWPLVGKVSPFVAEDNLAFPVEIKDFLLATPFFSVSDSSEGSQTSLSTPTASTADAAWSLSSCCNRSFAIKSLVASSTWRIESPYFRWRRIVENFNALYRINTDNKR